MVFRFTLHAALSTAVATADLDGGKTKVSSGKEQGKGEEMNDIAEVEKTNAAFRNPFVPRKLKEKYHNHPPYENPENTFVATAYADARLFQNQNAVPSKALLNNPSSYRGMKDGPTTAYEIQDATTSVDAIFDASEELGVLDSGKITFYAKQQRELADKIDLADCDGNHPLVSPDLNFQALVKRCLYYKDNCPIDATLPLKCWDTSQVTDMSYAFYQLIDFNEPLDSWETSAVTDMSDMFGFAESFDRPLNSWNIKSVTDSSDMFWGAKSFNQPLNSWDTSAIKFMDYMFLNAIKFNQPLDSWETAGVVNMRYMFSFTESFDQPLNSWKTSAVTDMSVMFGYASSFNQPIYSWETKAVTNMRSMFMGAESFNQNLDFWNTIAVTDMTYMFNRAVSFNQCLSTWAYKNPTTITGPFIFNGTGCSVQGIPDVVSGPWCQSAYDQCYPSTSVDYPSSSANSKYQFFSCGHYLAPVILFGVLLMPDITSSLFF